jgi:succinate dehydrogenase / fumarate reductase, cytochrome b subunit
MKTERPVNLDLTKFSFPIMAITSITHRITGVLLFVAIAYLLWLLDGALASADGFTAVSETLTETAPRLVLLGVIAMLWFHILAGLKHLVMDFHHWDTLEAGRRASQGVIVLTLAGVALAGVWLWS